ncbi:MAG: hypothetical protein DCC68_14275 [Planctomycetota bacterium]|nr:MAG: hypothetical protein DCC68_14275 [Planctomycetota bacterium]
MIRSKGECSTPTAGSASEAPDGWTLRTLTELGVGEKESISPQDYPDEKFDYYSIPAYQEGARPIIERGGNILSQKNVVADGTVLFGKL